MFTLIGARPGRRSVCFRRCQRRSVRSEWSHRVMRLSQLDGTLKRFRRTPWRFQQTFQTPLKNLKPFVATISSSLEHLSGACMTIDQVVFEPKHLISLLEGHSLPPQYGHELSITAESKLEAE